MPGQASKANVSITVPQVPNGCQAWEVPPAMSALEDRAVAGGTKVTLQEFGQTTALVFTSDAGRMAYSSHFRTSPPMHKLAAQWTHDLAIVEFDKVCAFTPSWSRWAKPSRTARN